MKFGFRNRGNGGGAAASSRKEHCRAIEGKRHRQGSETWGWWRIGRVECGLCRHSKNCRIPARRRTARIRKL